MNRQINFYETICFTRKVPEEKVKIDQIRSVFIWLNVISAVNIKRQNTFLQKSSFLVSRYSIDLLCFFK